MVAIIVPIVIFYTSIEGVDARTKPPLPPPISGNDVKIYISAFHKAKQGHWSIAHRIASKADESLGAKILKWMDYSRPYNYSSFETIEKFIKINPHWPRQKQLLTNAETSMSKGVQDRTIKNWFRWKDPVSKNGRLSLAKLLAKEEMHDQAGKLIKFSWVNDNFTRKELKEIYNLYNPFLDDQYHELRIDRLLWDNRQSDAKYMFHYVTKGQQLLATARIALRNFAGGVDKAIAEVPDNLKSSPGLMYERLRWRRLKGRHDSAREILLTSHKSLGIPHLWWRERKIQVRKSLNEGSITLAYRLASEHKQIGSASFAEAEWLAGWIALRFLNETELALKHFTTLYDTVFMPISKARAAYWAGRTLEAIDDKEGAQVWYTKASKYTGTYYGQLASARLPKNQKFAIIDRHIKTKSTIEGHELFAAIRLLTYLGKDRLADIFAKKLAAISKVEADYRSISRFAHSLNRPGMAIRSAKFATRNGYILNTDLFPLVNIPFAYNNNELEHALVLALIRQESLFDRSATSHAGAMGLMQLMPATAKGVSKSIRIPYAKYKLRNPSFNIQVGSTYLKDLIRKYDGSYVLALAAYNAGPSNVAKWIRKNGDPRNDSNVDLIDWIELITISETRNYVQRVLEGIQVYRSQLETTLPIHGLEYDLSRGISHNILLERCVKPTDRTLARPVVDLISHC